MDRVLAELGRPAHALGGVLGNVSIARAEFAFMLFSLADVATWLAILVYVFQRAGTGAAGLFGLIVLVPAALCAPVSAALGDRFPRREVVTYGYAAQAIVVLLTGLAMILVLPLFVVYACGILVHAVQTIGRPGHHSLLPGLARTPDELVAANSVSSLAEGLGAALGGVAVTVLTARGGPGLIYVIMAGVLAVAALLAAGVRGLAGSDAPVVHELRPWRLVLEAAGAMRVVARRPGPRLLMLMTALITLIFGALVVLIVALALGPLGAGERGVGILNVSLSAGMFVGAAVSISLVGRRLWPALMVGAMSMGIGYIALGLSPAVGAAVISIVVIGSASSLLDVAGRTLLQRIVDNELLTRVFGAVETAWLLGVGVGAALAPVLERLFGIAGALVVCGLVLPTAAVATQRRLRQLDVTADVPVRQLELLSAIPMFGALPRTELERIASLLVRIQAADGEVMIRQGDVGDRFYVVDRGEFVVKADGRPVAVLTVGDHYGEIALLHDVPRTATVAARGDGVVWSLDSADFLEAVVGRPQVRLAAHAVSRQRLRELEGPR